MTLDLPELSIAVIGMSGRFPGAGNVKALWDNLARGVKSIHFFSDDELLSVGVAPEHLQDPRYVKAGTFVEGVDLFDASFFGFTPREAEIMDPQSRLFLECSWEALEGAGYDPARYKGLVGVFAGKASSGYWKHNLLTQPDLVELVGELQIGINNEQDSLPLWVAYKLDLKGPSVSVQTFCSTSLVAVHVACQSLLAYDCDMALAGGVALQFPLDAGYWYLEGGIPSPDGECRAFDAKANGSIMSNGLGVVLLKRLEDAIQDGDHIYAVIRGSAASNDGIGRAGFTAPSVLGQSAVIAAALGNAKIDPETISYVEAHGTGTPLGDAVELSAMLKVFRQNTDKKGFCAVSSMKPNIGHLDRAAGVVNLIKVVLAFQNKQIPPSINFEKPNPEIDWGNSPFYVNTELREWKSNGPWPRRAGTSAFGLGGANAHVVLEEAPPVEPSSPSRPHQLLLVSAKTEAALEVSTSNLATFLQSNPTCNLADVAYTLQVGRGEFNYRRMLVCHSAQDAAQALAMSDPQRVLSLHQTHRNRPVALMFAGVGDHYVGMGRELYETEAVFREALDECSHALQPYLGCAVRELLYPPEENPIESEMSDELRGWLRGGSRARTAAEQRLQQTTVAQPVVFAVDYALTRLLVEWGIQPKALIGYSLGEYVAACVAGVLTLDDALRLVAERAQMIQELPEGAMLAVSCSEEQAQRWLSDEVCLAGHLGQEACVLSGRRDAIEAVAARLEADEIACRMVETTHAFHSSLMRPLVERLTRLAQTARLRAPRIPYLSNVTGRWITAEDATDPAYWGRHLCQPVRFYEGLGELLSEKTQVLVEVGPGSALGSFAKQHPSCEREQLAQVVSTLRAGHERQSDAAHLLGALGKLWLLGVEPDWDGFYARETRHRVPLPTYPFQRQRYWIQPDGASAKRRGKRGADSTEANEGERQPFSDWFYLPSWKQTGSKSLKTPAGQTNWLVFTDQSQVSQAVVRWLKEYGQAVVEVQAGRAFRQLSGRHYELRPQRRDDYEELVSRLKQHELLPSRIAHLWGVTGDDGRLDTDAGLEGALGQGLYSLMSLAQALGEADLTAYQLSIVASQIHQVTGMEQVRPERATLLGPVRVIPQEYPQALCRLIDICPPQERTWQAEAFLNNLMGELVSDDFTETVVALRGSQRWAQIFERQPMPPANVAELLRPHGVYLITGGLGGIGLAMAEHLAETAQARLVLVGRTPLPPRDEWARLLAEQGGEKGVGYKLRRIQRLEELGAEVLVVSADVSHLGQMQAAIQQAVTRFGTLHGVLHTAGVPGIGLLQLKTPEMVAKVLAPKVQGTLVLERALQGISLDWLVLFSSVSAIAGGGPGQFGYAAANAFLDAYAVSRQGEKRSTLSIGWNEWQWNAWEEGLEGFSPDVQKVLVTHRKKHGISFPEGCQALAYALASRLPHVIVSPPDLGQIIASNRNFTVEGLARLDPKQASRPRYPRPTLGTSYIAPRNELEQKIADVWGEILGIADIGAMDNFFDLGGNSLVGLNMIARLKKELGLAKFPARVVYEAPSVSEMAKFLMRDRGDPETFLDERLERGQMRRQAAEQRGRARE